MTTHKLNKERGIVLSAKRRIFHSASHVNEDTISGERKSVADQTIAMVWSATLFLSPLIVSSLLSPPVAACASGRVQATRSQAGRICAGPRRGGGMGDPRPQRAT